MLVPIDPGDKVTLVTKDYVLVCTVEVVRERGEQTAIGARSTNTNNAVTDPPDDPAHGGSRAPGDHTVIEVAVEKEVPTNSPGDG